MWKSLGDRNDIIKHCAADSPRRIKTNVYVIILLIINFILFSFSFRELLLNVMSVDTYDILCMGVLTLSTLLACGLFVAKYYLNKKEVDVAILCTIVMLALIFIIM